MAKTANAKTRQEGLYLQIRARLLRGEFAPGEPIRTDQLCANYGVSVSVAREVLTRLAEQRLVAFEANKGFRVAPLTAENIADLCLVRSELEALTISLAIKHGSASWEASVVAAHHELAITPRPSIAEDPEGNERWAMIHSRFHAACAAGCGSPRLCAVRQQFFDEAEIVRQYSRLYGAGRDVEGEHAAIVQAIIARDAELAQSLVRAHVELTAQATTGRVQPARIGIHRRRRGELMDLGLAGRHAIVAASSRGLGRACADALGERGRQSGHQRTRSRLAQHRRRRDLPSTAEWTSLQSPATLPTKQPVTHCSRHVRNLTSS